MAEAILVVSVLISGLLAGNELATLVAFHPALQHLPFQTQIEAERSLTRRLGGIMPAYMTVALVAAVAAAITLLGEPEFALALAAAVSLALMLAITLTRNVPLNRRTVDFPPDGDEASWSELRRSWERLHAVRVVLDLTAFACLVAALSAR